MKNKPSAIGDKIKEIRKDKGLTQKELGELLGVTASMIGQWESGIRFPRVANIYSCLLYTSRCVEETGLRSHPYIPL